jgi:hypothetical protein
MSLIGVTDFYTLNFCIACEFQQSEDETFAAAKSNEGTLRVIGKEISDVKSKIHKWLELNRFSI